MPIAPPSDVPAQVQFRIAPNCPDKDAFQKFIVTLPPSLLPALRKGDLPETWDIEEPPDVKAWRVATAALDLPVNVGSTDTEAIGWAVRDDSVLIIKRDSGYKPVEILAHEVNHVVWWETLTDAQRKEFRKIYRKDAHKGRSVSWYAMASCDPCEGFCEAGRLFLTGDRAKFEKDFQDQAHFWQKLTGEQ